MSMIENVLSAPKNSQKLLITAIQFSKIQNTQVLKATQKLVQIIKTYITQAMQIFRIYTTIQDLNYQYIVEFSLSESIVNKRISQLGLGKFLKMINDLNMHQDNKFILMWDDDKDAILMRSFLPKLQHHNNLLIQGIEELWHYLGNFAESLLPAPKKQIWTKQHDKMKQAITNSMKLWKQLVLQRKKYQKKRNNQDKSVKQMFTWFAEQNYYRKIIQQTEKSAKQQVSILQYIKINYLDEQFMDYDCEGKNCNLTVYYSEYQIFKMQISRNIQFNKSTHSEQLQKSQEQSAFQQKIQDYLVLKQPLHWDKQPFEREKSIILYLRNVKCKYIAQYFFQYLNPISQSKTYESANQFYMPKYPLQFQQTNWDKKKFEICLAVTKGVQILGRIGLIHRDLKPSNLVLENDYNPKIIDFGSAGKNNMADLSILPQIQIRTTRKYNVVWEMLPIEIKNLIPQKQFNSHPLFDIYALGKIYQIILRSLNAKTMLGSFLIEHIDFLVSQCVCLNPNQRLYPLEIIAFISNFINYQKNNLIVY